MSAREHVTSLNPFQRVQDPLLNTGAEKRLRRKKLSRRPVQEALCRTH